MIHDLHAYFSAIGRRGGLKSRRSLSSEAAREMARLREERRKTLAVLSGLALPGADLVATGLDDLRAGRETKEALLVAIGAPRLRSLGHAVPRRYSRPEKRLYALLSRDDQDSAHSRYNALVRRLVSYERAAECAL